MDVSIYSKIGKFKMFKQNEIVFMQNDLGDNMYIVLKGVFGVYINSFTDFPVRVSGISVGEHFGEMAVLDGWPRSATIISEEQSTAISIDKDNLITLLKTDSRISKRILNSLNKRLNDTAEIARSKGNTVPELPDWLNPELSDDENENHEKMVLIAQRIRELNEVIGIDKEEPTNIKVKKSVKPVTLLPPGHERFTQVDTNDNSRILAEGEYICPYCGKGFKGKIPIFSRLEQKETTFDQRIIYNNFNMLMYTNIVCPNCNYCDTYQNFQSVARPLDLVKVVGNQFMNIENFTGYANDFRHTLDETVLSYYLNLQCLENIPDSELLCAKGWHRLYWLYGDYNEPQKKQVAASEAVKYYVAYLKKNIIDLSILDSMAINAIIAQLYIDLNDLETAKKYLEINVNVGEYAEHEIVKKSVKKLADL